MKGVGAVGDSTRNFIRVRKNLDDQKRSDKPKTVDSETVLQTKEANLVSYTRRVYGELGFTQFSVFRQLHDLRKSIYSQIVPHVAKILQDF